MIQYRRFRSSKPCVTVLCRDWCIRSTLFIHSTALLARTVRRSTRATASYDFRQFASTWSSGPDARRLPVLFRP